MIGVVEARAVTTPAGPRESANKSRVMPAPMPSAPANAAIASIGSLDDAGERKLRNAPNPYKAGSARAIRMQAAPDASTPVAMTVA
jgi:hypothetical protein